MTARRDFGVEEPSWLPQTHLTAWVARTYFIDELSDAEVDEIRHAAPRLAPLLDDTHPARDVTPGISSASPALQAVQGTEPVPRTEAEMAEQWWQTADGRIDRDHRERRQSSQSFGGTGAFAR